MDSVVNGLLTFFSNLDGILAYGGVALVMVLAAPELVMPFVGFLVLRGDLGFVGVLLAGTSGAMLGQFGIYWSARAVGEGRIRGFIRRRGGWLLLTERDLERTLRLFDRFENTVIFFGRVVPTVRSLISVPAGLKRTPPSRFFFLTGLGTALWNALLLYAGMLVGRNWAQVVGVLETYQTVILIVLGALLVALSVRRVKAQLAR